MAMKEDVNELREAMWNLEDAVKRRDMAMHKITDLLGHSQAQEVLDAFGISLHYEGGVRMVRSKAYVNCWREYYGQG